MEEEFSMDDPAPLLKSASDFAFYPGFQNDAVCKEFLDRFPLPLILSALQTKSDVPALETTLVACLERIFKTKYGASFIPHYMTFVELGLKSDSQPLRCLACRTVTCLLEYVNDETISPAQLVIDNNLYPLLLDCLVNGDEQVATASMDAIKKFASFPEGIEVIFPENNDVTHLRNLSAQCSSMGRVRVLSLIVKLFSVSVNVASAIHSSNLLSLLEAEVGNTDDTLVALSILELLYELAEVQHGTEFLSRTTLIQLLSSIISNPSTDPILISRAMTITGRLLSKENFYELINESCVKPVISAIDGRLGLDSQDPDECECALEALGQIGLSVAGANLVLLSSPPAARHVIEAAFDRHSRGKQLAALHSLGNISGESRSESNRILNGDAEENLRILVYNTASKTPKLTPSGLFLSVLQQDSEIRLAAYRMITGLVARPWCLMEVFSKQDIVNVVTDPITETTKIGMEARYNCCKAIHKELMSSTKLSSNPAVAGIAKKLQEAVSKGPYLTGKHREVQPSVKTAERF
ncbi:ARM repeat superfamily protein [Euphorbia peplus]|nr:ARM repeat superfamily protein [Euphorbia peplus]